MSIFERLVQKGTDIGQASQRARQVSAMASQLQENERKDVARFPRDAENMKPCFPKLREELERYRDRGREKTEAGFSPVNASMKLFLSKDRMNAYVCLLPPMDGGEDISERVFWEELYYEGISAGLQEDLAKEYIYQRQYLRLFPIARGVPPKAGEDGGVEELFQRMPPLSIETARDCTMDFSNRRPVVMVHRGETICNIRFPVPGVDGHDVTGRTIPCREGKSPRIPMGMNTTMSSDGTKLVAKEDGVLYAEDGKFYIQPANVLKGPVDSPTVEAKGDLFVDGDVLDGGEIVVSGNVFVQGAVIGGTVRATAGSVRAQAGIRENARVSASGQVQTPSIDNSTVSAGGNVYAEVIADSDVICGGSVYVNGGRGLILGGFIKARKQIVCTQIGNVSGQPGKVAVGYFPEVIEEIEELDGRLEIVRETLEKLRKSIAALRMGGETLSLEKRALLNQLTEQRSLYEQQESDFSQKLKAAKEKMRTAMSGKIVCGEMYPPVTVYISDRIKEFTLPETGCNIHVYAGQVVAK